MADRAKIVSDYLPTQAAIFLFAALLSYAAYSVIPRLRPKHHATIAFVFALLAVLILAFVYPKVDARRPAGTDTDDALRIGVDSLVKGEDPYQKSTYLENPVAPLPGSFILAAPSVLLTGRSGAANLMAFAVGAGACSVLVARSRRRQDLLLWIGLLAATPAVWLELANGADELANGCWLMASAMWVVSRPRHAPGVATFLTGAAFAVTLLTRTVAPVIMVLPVAVLWARGERRNAGLVTLGAGLCSAALLAPWLGAIVAGDFAPISVVADHKLTLSGLDPIAYQAVLASGIVAAFALGVWACLRRRLLTDAQERTLLLAGSSLVLMLPIFLLVLLAPSHFGFGGYAKIAIPFITTWLVLGLSEHAEASRNGSIQSADLPLHV